MEKPRSLKFDFPPAAELARARDQILGKLASFKMTRDKIRMRCPTKADQEHDKAIVEEITKRLWALKRPNQSKVMVYNQVVEACYSVEAGKHSPRPAVVEEVTKDLVSAARELLRVLGSADLPAYYRFVGLGHGENRKRFIEQLERLTKLTYRKPPRNIDREKRLSAVFAHLLITEHTVETPDRYSGWSISHRDWPDTPVRLSDGGRRDRRFSKSACDEVLKHVRAGSNLETETGRWFWGRIGIPPIFFQFPT